MSEEMFSVVAIISGLASVATLWSSIRRRQLMRRLLRSLDDAQRRELGTELLQNSGLHSPMVATKDADGRMDGPERPKLVRPAPNPVDALERVLAALETARLLLEEAYAIGLWSKSDDSSDNRRKRQRLRETDWALSSALRALRDLRSHQPDLPVSLSTLEDELRALIGVLEPLPDTVTDTMGENSQLDSKINEISYDIANLTEKTSHLVAEYGRSQVGDGASR